VSFKIIHIVFIKHIEYDILNDLRDKEFFFVVG